MRIEPVTPDGLDSLSHLTFPTVLSAARRHREALLAFAATTQDAPCGLAVAVRGPRDEFELLSLFVTDLFRRRGFGSRLLSAVERACAEAGSRTGVHFLTTQAQDQGPVRFLMRSGWGRPVVRSLICHSTVARMFGAPPPSSPDLPEHYRIVSWSDVGAEDRAAIAAGVGVWVPEDLNPLGLEAGYDGATSVALVLERGVRRVVGWIITHRLDGDTLRWTCSFVDPALQSAVRIMPLWWEVGRRQGAAGGCQDLTFTVPLTHPRMVRFTNRYMKPRLTALNYACVTTKRLGTDGLSDCSSA